VGGVNSRLNSAFSVGDVDSLDKAFCVEISAGKFGSVIVSR